MDDTLPQQLVKTVGGSFKTTALLQKRVRELVRGQKPLFETREEAQAAATDHLEFGAEPPEEPKGFLAKRRAKKEQRPEWQERRRG